MGADKDKLSPPQEHKVIIIVRDSISNYRNHRRDFWKYKIKVLEICSNKYQQEEKVGMGSDSKRYCLFLHVMNT